MENIKKTGDREYALDVCGRVCPYPLVLAKTALKKMEKGEILVIIFDYPGSVDPITNMCGRYGHEIIDKKGEGGKFIYKIQRG